MADSIKNIKDKSIVCILLILSGWGILSCNNPSKAPDVAQIKVTMNTRRFDQDLARIDTAHIADGLQNLKKKYPDFLDFWLDDLMRFGVKHAYTDQNPIIKDQVHMFLTYKDYRGLFDTVNKHFPDTRTMDESLQKGFQFWKFYYPQRSVPKIVYFVSGLNNWSVITVDTDIVGIGLDMYLGPDYPYYKSVGIPDYMAQSLKPEYAPVNVFKALYEAKHPFEAENRSLLDLMIQRGKEQYFTSKMIPFVPTATRFGFTDAQLEWCTKNEALIYNFFVKANLLYETNWSKILRYVNDGPDAAGMPKESPGNVGTWLGAQVVNAYVAKHQGMSLDSLFAITDAQTILQEGGYKPR